jgi:hypothetical protein
MAETEVIRCFGCDIVIRHPGARAVWLGVTTDTEKPTYILTRSGWVCRECAEKYFPREPEQIPDGV